MFAKLMPANQWRAFDIFGWCAMVCERVAR